MPSLEDLIGTITRMAEKSQQNRQDQHDSLGIEKYWGGTTSNESRANDEAIYQAKMKRIDEQNKQKDLMSEGRDNREKALTLANMQNVREEGINQRYLDAARIRRGDPLNPDGEFSGNSVGGGLGGVGGGRSAGGRGGKADMSREDQAFQAYASKMKEDTPMDKILESQRMAYAPAPGASGAVGVSGSPQPQRFKIGEQGQAISGQTQQPATNTLQGMASQAPAERGIQTPYGDAPTSMAPSQWQAYADSRSADNPGKKMEYQGLQNGMVGDQIARFKREDGSIFFANTGAARMQAGGPGIQPGPNLEGIRNMRSGLGSPVQVQPVPKIDHPPQMIAPPLSLSQQVEQVITPQPSTVNDNFNASMENPSGLYDLQKRIKKARGNMDIINGLRK